MAKLGGLGDSVGLSHAALPVADGCSGGLSVKKLAMA